MREPGYYWILLYDEWQPAKWSQREDAWETIGSDDLFVEDEIKSVGSKLESPTDL
jgi:hypothetical protein